ncbi:hypothetical protein BB559_002330 [Furculomyces boomerangus]|uniref:Mitotic-spindle organizing protein 1 n=2 Tax=Harpellales TaxID=61421 RepID=A0A2T9YW99_9FUNG|nr:hypothetical protein BB559_002330 [Furculomyces boomerangus]PWA03657.1 hypothetical protein BB558_000152 [Smittium angustum]
MDLGPYSNYIVEGLQEISEILDIELNKDQISSIIRLLNMGANPVAIAAVVKELKAEQTSRNY